ncbi:MAG: hypothetical protein IJA54_07945 [Tyzzerella sp.]|nr:hypothetical protein [Tyzzerella sp.]
MAAINYDDERFAEVEADKQQALTENEQLYNGMINQSDKYFQQQIDASKEWGEKQQQLQQEQTDFAIEQIGQQKAQAEKDYKREQSGAYVDLQKQTNQYGAEAEQMAASGLANTGFSETSKVGMQNAYQNRVAMARESYNQAVLNFNNAITEARLQNSSALAEIAYNTLQQQLQLALEGFQYHNSLVLDQANRKQDIENTYYGRYQDVVNQINQENALAEEKRQYNESIALQKAQLAEEQRQYNASLTLQKQQAEQQQAIIKQYAVNTAYYQGELNGDAEKYGTFSNGYQPKGISGYGKVSKTGDTITFKTQTLSGQKQTVTQNIWKTPDGTKWYWDGTKNQYIRIK